MSDTSDDVEWSRQHWAQLGEENPDGFAGMAALLRTHQVMVAALEQALKPYELTLTAYLLLSTLLMTKGLTRPLGQLSRHLMIHPTTVTLLIDQLEKRDLIRRSPHVSDRRVVLAGLTPGGRRLTKKAGSAIASINYGLGSLGPDEARDLTGILRSVRQDLGDPVEPDPRARALGPDR